MSRARSIALALLSGVLLLAGCGDARTRAVSLTAPSPPQGFHALGYPKAGVALEAPRNWSVIGERSPMVTLFSSGSAVVSVYRFPRASPPPAGAPALDAARAALVGAARARDPSLTLIRSRSLTIDGAAAIEIDAFERIGDQSRRVRSTHVYVHGAELVLDEYAPPTIFHAVDHAVFSPVRRSLRLIPVTTA